MTDLMIAPPIADQLRAIADQENRSIEAVLSTLLAQYAPAPPLDAAIKMRLAENGITLPSPDADIEPPLTEQEAQALADRIGAMGSLSELVIQERREGR